MQRLWTTYTWPKMTASKTGHPETPGLQLGRASRTASRGPRSVNWMSSHARLFESCCWRVRKCAPGHRHRSTWRRQSNFKIFFLLGSELSTFNLHVLGAVVDHKKQFVNLYIKRHMSCPTYTVPQKEKKETTITLVFLVDLRSRASLRCIASGKKHRPKQTQTQL